MKFASRLDGIDLSGLRKMFELSTEDSVNLGLGEPDFNPPKVALDALKTAVYEGKNKYGPTAGIPQLRTALAERNSIYKKGLTADNVMITGSGSEALLAAMIAFIDQGDEVLYPDPGFVLYKPQVKLMGGKPVAYPVEQANGFVPQVETLNELITPKTKAIVVNSPSNPTGAVYDEKYVRSISELAMEHDLVIISDEVYDSVIYDTRHHSFLGDYENVVFINSFSKIYAMTGWRLGYVISSPELIKALIITHYHIMACPASPFQHAALATMSAPQEFVKEMVNEFKQRRDLIVERLNSIAGMNCLLPRGAFYAFPAYEQEIPSNELAMKFARAGVICSPGSAFGPGGEGHIRFSYAASKDQIEKGMDIVEKVMNEL